MLYLRDQMYMMGTPGILRMRRFRSTSHVAYMVRKFYGHCFAITKDEPHVIVLQSRGHGVVE
jgi:hypothetical protein